MAIIKLNNYIPGKDVENLIDNVDIDRLGVDKTMISVNYGTSPATVTVLQGSIIECSGDTYLVDADNAFSMANTSDNYLRFNGTAFSSTSSIGTFDISKQGYYSTTYRTLKFHIDQTEEVETVLLDILYPDLTLFSNKFDKIKVGLSTNGSVSTSGFGTLAQLNTIYTDFLGSFDTTNYNFTAVDSGYYLLSVHGKSTEPATLSSMRVRLIKNDTDMLIDNVTFNNAVTGSMYQSCCSSTILEYLEVDDKLELYGYGSYGAMAYGEDKTFLAITRVL